jgi:hypothetical protein
MVVKSSGSKRVAANVHASDYNNPACGGCEGKKSKRVRHSSNGKQIASAGGKTCLEALNAGRSTACGVRRDFDDEATHTSDPGRTPMTEHDEATHTSHPGRTPMTEQDSATGLRLSDGSHIPPQSAKSPTSDVTGALRFSPHTFVDGSLGARSCLQKFPEQLASEGKSIAKCTDAIPLPTILRKVGEGIFGRVFECVWGEKKCAVKIKALEDDVDVEVNVLKRLARNTYHPGILRLLGWGMQMRAKKVFHIFLWPQCHCAT